MDNPERDQEKLANTVLYLLKGCAPAQPSLTALLKMLWFADSRHYRQHLASITGRQYVALKNGPVFDNYTALFQGLVDSGVVEKTTVPIHGMPNPKEEYQPLQEPNTAVFLPSELEVLDAVIAECSGKSGTLLSGASHRDAPWIFAWDADNPGNPIPYAVIRWMDNLPEESDIDAVTEALARPGVAATIEALNAAKVA